jgi:hypothetical protein
MLYSQIIAVCSQIHTKHINTLCGQNVEFVNVKPDGTHSDHDLSWLNIREVGRYRRKAAASDLLLGPHGHPYRPRDYYWNKFLTFTCHFAKFNLDAVTLTMHLSSNGFIQRGFPELNVCCLTHQSHLVLFKCSNTAKDRRASSFPLCGLLSES